MAALASTAWEPGAVRSYERQPEHVLACADIASALTYYRRLTA
ncbi:hypothetical protein [Streptomyces canus]